MDEITFLDLLQEKRLFLSPNMTCRSMMRMLRMPRPELDALFQKKYGGCAEKILERMRLSHARELMLKYGMSFDSAVIFSGFPSKRKAKKALAALEY